MKSVYEIKEKCFAELKVTVDGQQWKDATSKAFKKLANEVEIKGFRKGHVPLEMAKKVISNQQVFYQGAENIAQEALDFGLNEHKEIKLIDRPQLDVESVTEDEVTLKFILTVSPTVTLGDYKNTKYEPKKVKVVKSDVDEQIENLRKQNAEEVLQEDDAQVKKGSIAVIDFEGFVDGVAFEGGKGTEYPLEIGSNSFIPGFEDQLIGMKTNEEKDINVKFPHEYAEELADKDAVFKVKVDSIKEKQLPELNDEFVKSLKMENVETVEQLNETLKERLKTQRTNEAQEEATNKLLDQLCEICPVDIPDVLINREVEDTLDQYKQRIAAQGIDFNMYLQITGSTLETFKEQIRPECEKKVRIRLVLDAIGTDMKVEVSEKEIDEEYEAMASQYEMEVSKIKGLIPAEYLSEDIKMRKTLDTLKANKPEKEAVKEGE